MATQFTSPVGRLVWGNPLNPKQKEKDGRKLTKDDGSPILVYEFGLAIQKSEFKPVGDAMAAEAKALFPNGPPPNFAYKMKDGDKDVDSKGAPLRDKPGRAGCYILACSTEYPVRCFQNQGGALVQITQGIKTGDFIRAQLNINGHAADPHTKGSKAGLYINPNMVELVGYGEAIATGPDPSQAFAQPAALPAGASATPTAQGPLPSGNPPQANAPEQPASPPAPHTSFPWGQ